MSAEQLRRDVADAIEMVLDGQAARLLAQSGPKNWSAREYQTARDDLKARVDQFPDICDWSYQRASRSDLFTLYRSMTRLAMGTLYVDRRPDCGRLIVEASQGCVDALDWARLALERDWSPLTPLDYVPYPFQRSRWPLKFERCRRDANSRRVNRVASRIDAGESYDGMSVKKADHVSDADRGRFVARLQGCENDFEFYRWIDREADLPQRRKVKLALLGLSMVVLGTDGLSEALVEVERAETDRAVCILALSPRYSPFV